MAKRKKSSKDVGATASPSMPERKSVETEECENGYVICVSHEGKNGYSRKRYVASTQPEATRIAAQGMRGLSKKSAGKKKGRGKRFSSKKA